MRSAWTLQFNLSSNGDDVGLIVHGAQGHPVDLGRQPHHHALLALARARRADPEGGWLRIEQLVGALGTDRAHLDVQLFRAGRQLRQAQPALPALVERRRGALRLAEVGIWIVRGTTPE